MHAWLSVLEPCMQAAAAIAERRVRDADNAAMVAQRKVNRYPEIVNLPCMTQLEYTKLNNTMGKSWISWCSYGESWCSYCFKASQLDIG